ncbi:hypothetical protein Tco_0010281 [Tanacetum coccineum]
MHSSYLIFDKEYKLLVPSITIALGEILLKMNLPDHRIKLWWKWRYLVPVESIHSPMLTLNVFNQRHHDNQKTYNTASATLISNVMIKKSVSMPVRKSQRHMKNTLAEYMILSGADNRPSMLDKDLYDSWKSKMELYMQNREHERMILESVEHGPLIWPTVEENGVIRTKKYAKVVKDLWERVRLLMQGTSLTKQERECELYDAFDKFTHIKGESLHTLPPEWSKFVTDVKIVKDSHTSNFDQLHAYLEQHELHANKVRIMRERNQDPLAFVANQQMTPPHFNTYQSYYNNPQLQQQFSPLQHGSIQPNQHYSSHYPSQTQFNHSSIPPSHTFQSQMNHQKSTVP